MFTWSNAFLKSINVKCNRLLVFRNESITDCNIKTLPTVERDLREPDSVSPIILNVSAENVNLLFIILVNNLPSVLKRGIPLLIYTSFILPFFKIGTITPSLHAVGKWDYLKITLNKQVNFGNKIASAYIYSSFINRSFPAAFPHFNSLTVCVLQNQ